jgi:LmbE family N-acetylglucosaminyl deacetylase
MADAPVVVGIGAHAADVEFSAGAALLKHALNGWQAHIVHFTLGEKGNPGLSPEEYGAQKRQEAEAAAGILHATPHFLPYRDGELSATDEAAQDLARLLRQLRPQAVVTHWRDSIHTDHTVVHHLTRRALFMACNAHFDLGGLPRMPWARLYFAENWEDAENFRPYVYVDISEVMDGWEQAFKCYAIGRGEGGYPYWDWYQAQTRIRGIEIGTTHAQAFAVDPSAVRKEQGLL